MQPENMLGHVGRLVADRGYIQRNPEDYDRRGALDRELVIRFLKETQPTEWDKLTVHYQAQAEQELFNPAA